MVIYYRGHIEDVYDLCWSDNSQYLMSGSVDNSVIIWDCKAGNINNNNNDDDNDDNNNDNGCRREGYYFKRKSPLHSGCGLGV